MTPSSSAGRVGSVPAGGIKTLNAAWYSQQTNKNNVTSGVWVPRGP